MDLKTTFLNGVIEEEVYIEHQEDFEVYGRESHVCRLKRALYGLKQAPKAWYESIDSYLQGMDYVKNEADSNLYYIMTGEEPLILVLYVGDLFLTSSRRLITDCKRDLASEFDMKDLGSMHYFLGLEVWQRNGEICLGRGKYIVEILKRFRMQDYQPMSTHMVTNWKKIDASKQEAVDSTLYMQLIGSLMYLVNTRPNICFVVNTLSRVMVEPRRAHWTVGKHMLRYLRGTVEYGLRYARGDGVKLMGYTNADWASNAVDRKNTSNCCFSLGSGVVSWFNGKQNSIALSFAEAEYIAACEAVWHRKLLMALLGQELELTIIHCDNQSCIKLSGRSTSKSSITSFEIVYRRV
jgi:hypothetical protein